MPPTLGPGAVGLVVADLHQHLLEQAAMPPEGAAEEASRTFGPITAGAVRSFQASHGLAPDGIVGPRTWAAILGGDGPGPVPPSLDLATATPLGRLALIIADGELKAGVTEDPMHSNRGPRVDLYLTGDKEDAPYLLHVRQAQPAPADGWQGAPWCGRLARWCVERAVAQLGVRSPLAGLGDLASAWKWRDAGKRAGLWRVDPEAGRVAMIIVEGTADHPAHGHVVMLAGPVDAHGMVATREGNSNDRLAGRLRAVAEFNGGFVELLS